MYTRLSAPVIVDCAFTRSSLMIKSLFGDFPAATSTRPVIIKAPEITESHKDLQSCLIFIAPLARPHKAILCLSLVAVNNLA